MVEVRLHGELAKDFGRVWSLDIKSPKEAIAAIDANRPGFRRKILELAQQGMCFRVRTRSHDYDDKDVHTHLGREGRVDIIPIVMGSSAGVRFVIGAVLVAANFLTGFNNPYVYQAGAALMLGSIVEWLTPVPKRDDANKSADSWTFNGPTNNVDQGMPVPIIYGEVLTGGYTISGGISISQLNAAGSTDPVASIGGETSHGYSTVGVGGAPSGIFQLSVGTFNLDEPYTYLWTLSGFSGATTSMTGSTSATMRLKVLVPALDTNAQQTVTGTVSVTVSGFKPSTSGAGAPVAASASASTLVTAAFDNLQPPGS